MKKQLYLFFILILSISFSNCSQIAAGSYPYAELYKLDYPESKVIKAIQAVKAKNLDLQVTEDLTDTDSTDYWHNEWFMVENQLIKTWTRPSEKNKTTFALVCVGTFGNCRQVNNELSSSEDSEIKEQFQELVLDRVKIELQNSNSH
ncbi:hypothetical protein NAT51_08075 [Flavobacterium amniphilum]|uniref:hypothetical protein n=1 Tax=Flavobacterium amniphilum TaxID=1834035 RepID=UPI00202AB9E9|nr:hypothetical protein [Flavobacterium amniphilum]MCL9805475.1 hypothetical protein [Flavobacterium amniphilum]